MRTVLTTIAACSLIATSSLACEVSSGPQTTALIELYTSEGCNSCPPADQWFSRYRQGGNNAGAVLLAFHVDYWDYIGWKDRFASPLFGERQRMLVSNRGGRTVYTPQVFVNGRDTSWRGGEVEDAIKSVNRNPAEADLNLKLDPVGNNQWNIALSGIIKRPVSSQKIWIAVYEDGLSSDVRAGENSGVKLRHDRVVRQWLGPFRADAQGNVRLMQTLNTGAINTAQAGLASFIQDNATGRILQAITLPFCKQS